MKFWYVLAHTNLGRPRIGIAFTLTTEPADLGKDEQCINFRDRPRGDQQTKCIPSTKPTWHADRFSYCDCPIDDFALIYKQCQLCRAPAGHNRSIKHLPVKEKNQCPGRFRAGLGGVFELLASSSTSASGIAC